MLNLSRSTNYRDAPNYIELKDNLISHPSAKVRLPRHISSLESPQHNRTTNVSRHPIARKCLTNPDTYPAEATNLAVNILRYQLQDSMAKQKHLENLRNNLQHRLTIAQTNKNCQLVTMLQEESRQLETSK
jgi:hypothetical protein